MFHRLFSQGWYRYEKLSSYVKQNPDRNSNVRSSKISKLRWIRHKVERQGLMPKMGRSENTNCIRQSIDLRQIKSVKQFIIASLVKGSNKITNVRTRFTRLLESIHSPWAWFRVEMVAKFPVNSTGHCVLSSQPLCFLSNMWVYSTQQTTHKP